MLAALQQGEICLKKYVFQRTKITKYFLRNPRLFENPDFKRKLTEFFNKMYCKGVKGIIGVK